MILRLPHGGRVLEAEADWLRMIGVLEPRSTPAVQDPVCALDDALDRPIGMDCPFEACLRPGDAVAVVVSDASRKTGVQVLLPRLIERMERRGIVQDRISFLVALGVHRPASSEEQAHILGEDLYRRFSKRIFNHDAHDHSMLVRVGVTSRGTDVWLNRRLCECDRAVTTGTVVPHYFAGFGGGRKSLVPGLAGARTIAGNHSLNLDPHKPMLNPKVRIGALDGNPVAEDMLEAALFGKADFSINTVLSAEGRLAGLFAGDLDAAHRAACRFAESIFFAPLPEKVDIAVAAASDAANFVQCHKALFNAYSAIKPEGLIILAAPLNEGLGSEGFRRYLEMKSPEIIIRALRQSADINGQTALSTLQKAPQTLLISNLSDEDAALLGTRKAPSLQEALKQARQFFRAKGVETPSCCLMPHASVTAPCIGMGK